MTVHYATTFRKQAEDDYLISVYLYCFKLTVHLFVPVQAVACSAVLRASESEKSFSLYSVVLSVVRRTQLNPFKKYVSKG